jgi:hypothetical protein
MNFRDTTLEKFSRGREAQEKRSPPCGPACDQPVFSLSCDVRFQTRSKQMRGRPEAFRSRSRRGGKGHGSGQFSAGQGGGGTACRRQ